MFTKSHTLGAGLMALALVGSLAACGSKSSSDSSSPAVPAKKPVTVIVSDAGATKTSISISTVKDIGQVAVDISGATSSEVSVALLAAPTSVAMVSKSAASGLSYSLSGDNTVAAGSYSMQVVARDQARCTATESDDSVCTNITAVKDDYDTTQNFQVTIENAVPTDTSTLTSTTVDTSTATSTSTSTSGGLFASYCADLTDAGTIKKLFCAMVNK